VFSLALSINRTCVIVLPEPSHWNDHRIHTCHGNGSKWGHPRYFPKRMCRGL
jgi:hypothetical protein